MQTLSRELGESLYMARSSAEGDILKCRIRALTSRDVASIPNHCPLIYVGWLAWTSDSKRRLKLAVLRTTIPRSKSDSDSVFRKRGSGK
jgi:hypothetical protein